MRAHFTYRGYNFHLQVAYGLVEPEGFTARIWRPRARYGLNFPLPQAVCGTEDQLKLWLLLATRKAERQLPRAKARLCDRCKGEIQQ